MKIWEKEIHHFEQLSKLKIYNKEQFLQKINIITEYIKHIEDINIENKASKRKEKENTKNSIYKYKKRKEKIEIEENKIGKSKILNNIEHNLVNNSLLIKKAN